MMGTLQRGKRSRTLSDTPGFAGRLPLFGQKMSGFVQGSPLSQ